MSELVLKISQTCAKDVYNYRGLLSLGHKQQLWNVGRFVQSGRRDESASYGLRRASYGVRLALLGNGETIILVLYAPWLATGAQLARK